MATRRESVVLELDDRFTPGMVKAAAATGTLDEMLNRLGNNSVSLDKLSGSSDRAEGSLRRLDSTSRRVADGRWVRMTKGVDGLISKLGILPAVAIAGTSALIPLGAEAAAITATLAAPIAVVGGGLTLFGLLSGEAIKTTEAQSKKIAQLKSAVDSAHQSLVNTQASAATSAANSSRSAQASAMASIRSARIAEANATTAAGRASAQQRLQAAHAALSARQNSISASQSASVTAAQRRYNEALTAYQAALKGLSPEQKKFLDAQSSLKAEFQTFIDKAGPSLLGPPTEALKVANDLLPKTEPIIKAVSGGLTGLIDDFDRYANTPGFSKFIHEMSAQVGPDLQAFGTIAGNVASPIGKLLLLLGRTESPQLLHWLEGISGEFDHWASSKQGRADVEKFFEYVHKVGPEVGDDIEAIAKAAGHVVDALAPLGPKVLGGVKFLADELSSIPTPVLSILAGGTVGAVGLQKVGTFKAASKLPKILRVGQNIGSALTGGLIPEAASKYGKGVQPVYVTNKGFAGNGGSGLVSDAEKGAFITALTTVAAVTALIGVATGVAYLTYKEFKFGAGGTPDTKHPSGANMTTTDWREFNADRLNSNTGGLGSEDNAEMKTVATHVDAVKASLQSASRQIDMIGPRADNAFGQAIRDVDHFSLKLQELRDPQLKVDLDARAAIASLERLQALRIKLLSGTARYMAADRGVGLGGGIGMHNANGGTIPGSRYPYGDKVLSFLAPGEEVITNRHGEADRFRRDRAAGRIPAYASGGTVDYYGERYRSRAGSSWHAQSIDYDRLAAAMANARPLYGDVHVTDGYGGFRREMEQDRRRAAMSGVRNG